MKYLALLAVPAVIYFVLGRQTPVAEVKEAIAQAEVQPLVQGPREVTPAASSSLKRPLDRTHEAIQQVKTRHGAGEF